MPQRTHPEIAAASEPTHQIYYEVARTQLDAQSRRSGSLDSKAGSIFSIGSIVLSIFGAALATGGSPTGWYVIPIALALAAYLVLSYASYNAYKIRGYDYRPHLPTLGEHSHGFDDATLRGWVADEMLRSIEHNDRHLREKASSVMIALKMLVAETSVLSIALMLRFLGL